MNLLGSEEQACSSATAEHERIKCSYQDSLAAGVVTTRLPHRRLSRPLDMPQDGRCISHVSGPAPLLPTKGHRPSRLPAPVKWQCGVEVQADETDLIWAFTKYTLVVRSETIHNAFVSSGLRCNLRVTQSSGLGWESRYVFRDIHTCLVEYSLRQERPCHRVCTCSPWTLAAARVIAHLCLPMRIPTSNGRSG
jgi:hypothetical protein